MFSLFEYMGGKRFARCDPSVCFELPELGRRCAGEPVDAPLEIVHVRGTHTGLHARTMLFLPLAEVFDDVASSTAAFAAPQRPVH